ncbi:23S rRNA (adenine(1618)-N(6))-methyltransferase RlmF [Thalassomonas sp. M1454]|uniref:23S rRNA (adenine(1618)-N(6))-methyltransferase RlmF n=1 Tax=Thalassomonas sp. M1454 TaxID=2594477 RepID=UPI00117ED7AC|nr:23S rRNA (adenine(1618)-N(6))-methyltransferase RlmF [Thalassomonas sp. M1454]TRX56907.1 23S rRNA (adenine(1618)-N(6))-methyltransferase RlmF [Thalassomonas sp. M1454]
MNKNHKKQPITKQLHQRNLHNKGYDFAKLIKSFPKLAKFTKANAYGNTSIDYSKPEAVKTLNAALLYTYYDISNWSLPEGALCPPIPGRVDYIHYIADLVKAKNKTIRLLDIGTGASGIYPILACQIYNWDCVASDINLDSIENVQSIISANPNMKGSLTLKHQLDQNKIFTGIISKDEIFDVSVCNPPFHASLNDAMKGSMRKVNNLARSRGEKVNISDNAKTTLNFGGQGAELWCKGGEQLFLKKMINESKLFATQCRWFTSLVSKIENIKPAKKQLLKLGAIDVKEIEMQQGNKTTRILAWTFISNQLYQSHN